MCKKEKRDGQHVRGYIAPPRSAYVLEAKVLEPAQIIERGPELGVSTVALIREFVIVQILAFFERWFG